MHQGSTFSSHPPLAFRLALCWAKYAPRGKGWVPRWTGRKFCVGAQFDIQTASGARLAVDTNNLDVYTSIIRLGGTWDQDVLDTCLAVLRPGDVFYDIGANVGFMSVEVARQVPSANVIAFEPQAALAHTIALSARLNNLCNLNVCELMIGETVGQAKLYLPANCILASAVPREPDATEMACPITTLDEEVCNHRLPPPNVIKVDVEGSELAVFRGARQVLAEHRPWIVFEADDNMQRFGYTRDDIRKCLQAIAGYKLFFIGEDGLYPTDQDIENPGFRDLLACPPERTDELNGRIR